jgi:hypothetical protein
MSFKGVGKMKKYIFLFSILGFFLLIQPISAQTWTTTKKLTYNSGKSSTPAIAVDTNGHLHVVWHDDTPGINEIYYKKSMDGGTTWINKRLTFKSGYSRDPSIAIDSNNHVHVVWEDNTSSNFEIYYKKSTDGGVTWITKRMTYNPYNSFDPIIAVSSNNHVHVVWSDSTPGNSEIFNKKSTDGGAVWTTKRLTFNSEGSFHPAIALDSNNYVHVVWQDHTPGIAEIYYKKSTDGGAAWTTKRLTYNAGFSGIPAIAIDSNDNLHVVWYDSTPFNSEIFYKKSTDGGVNWITKRLTYNSGGSYTPTIAIDSNGQIHVVWYDHTSGNSEIYYKKSTNGGTTWATKKLSWSSGDSEYPDIAIDYINHIHVVWHDDTPGNFEIYYKKGIQ